MIITFFGHSDFTSTEEYEKLLLDILENMVGDSTAEMFLGGYGGFDKFAYDCCKKYKSFHRNVKLIFVSPYPNTTGHTDGYDAVIYPEIEDKPPKFAISYRNKYMAERADFVIVFINRSYGGAYTAYVHAKRKGKTIYNLASQI